MKIAVVTDDGTTVAQHFGRARYYQVWTVENGSVTGTELRDRTATLRHGRGHDHDHDHSHGTHDHSGMVAQITDVEFVLAGGMGFRARQALEEAGMTVVATDITDTETAVTAWIDGTLTHRQERLH